MELDEYRAANLANWNDRVPIHWDSDGYKIRNYVDDPEYVSDVTQFDRDRDELRDVSGKTLLHLQCHIGTDTLSWARSGASVTGVDFSESAITVARKLSAESNTGVGARCWLPDSDGWAKVVAHFLKQGGIFYILEAHPIMGAVSDEHDGDLIVLDWPYFEAAGPQGYEEEESYTGTGTVSHTQQYNFPHGLGEIINA